MSHYKNVSSSPKMVLSFTKMYHNQKCLIFTKKCLIEKSHKQKCHITKNVSQPNMSQNQKCLIIKKFCLFFHHFFIFPETDENTNRPQSPVNQILEAIPAELYVPNQQQWISLKSGSKLATLPFCCR